jgi:hypothetical protein
MWRHFRKWRLIIWLRDQCASHKGRPSDGFVPVDKWGTIMVFRGAFAQLAARQNFLWALAWREAGRAKILAEMYSLVDAGIAEGLIESRRHDGRTLVRLSPKGEDFCHFMDFLQATSSRYRLAWGVVVPLIAFAAGRLSEHFPQYISFWTGRIR